MAESNTQEQQVKVLAWALDRIYNDKPCQTPGCDGQANLEPNRCVKCADEDGEQALVFPVDQEASDG